MKKTKKIFFIVLSIAAIGCFATVFNYNNDKAFDGIVTFLSIATGFNVTAYSIIANSKFSKYLYGIQDSSDNSKTLLHTLVDKFRESNLVFLSTIAIILFYFFITKDEKVVHPSKEILGYTFSIPIILKSIIWYLTILSFIKFFYLTTIFSRFVVRSSPND